MLFWNKQRSESASWLAGGTLENKTEAIDAICHTLWHAHQGGYDVPRVKAVGKHIDNWTQRSDAPGVRFFTDRAFPCGFVGVCVARSVRRGGGSHRQRGPLYDLYRLVSRSLAGGGCGTLGQTAYDP